jgi:hypothetical protein
VRAWQGKGRDRVPETEKAGFRAKSSSLSNNLGQLVQMRYNALVKKRMQFRAAAGKPHWMKQGATG